MIMKFFELRDEATRIAVLVTEYRPECFQGKDRWLYEVGGFGRVLVLTDLHNMQSYRSINDIKDRTINHAYYHICMNWEGLNSGDTLDIGFMLGYYNEQKKSDYKGQYEKEEIS